MIGCEPEIGDNEMKKKLFVLLIVLATFSLAAIPALAGPPQTARGTWLYIPTLLGSRQVGCNTFLTTLEEAEWTGTFVGESMEDGKVVIRCNGKWSFKAIISFHDLTVDGKTGTLRMSAVGRRPDALSDWTGKFVILSGTGELANLRGQGIFWGPGWLGDPTEQGVIYYEGNYHFEP